MTKSSTSKRFIDPRNAITFKLVHRSQRDIRIADENAPDFLLQPMQPSLNLQVFASLKTLTNFFKLEKRISA